MTQPEYVPLQATDRIRSSARLTIPAGWRADRPGDLAVPRAPVGPGLGSAGPDQGYGVGLAQRFEHRLVLTAGESAHDAVSGGFSCGMRRAAAFGRAPVIFDMEWAFSLWGFLADAPADLVAWRTPLFRGASHDYWQKRVIADAVAEEALRLTPAQALERVGSWPQSFVSPTPV